MVCAREAAIGFGDRVEKGKVQWFVDEMTGKLSDYNPSMLSSGPR
jgi:hypothetical protein